MMKSQLRSNGPRLSNKLSVSVVAWFFWASLLALGLPQPARAALEQVAPGVWQVTPGGGPLTSTFGTGRGDDNVTINIQRGAGFHVNDRPAISLGDHAIINIFGSIDSLTNSNSGGNYGTGPNTIEVNSYATITIEAGAFIIKRLGSGTAEAINVHGIQNHIINRGLISTADSSAIWFQDQVRPSTPGERNIVENYGIIEKEGGGNVIGSSAPADNRPGIIFINHAGATVVGDLLFGGGDDDLVFEAGSGVQSVTGRISGGGGANTLTLTGTAGTRDTLSQAVSNFQKLIKDEDGRWDISGVMTGFQQVLVKNGALGLQGDNENFNGVLVINPNVDANNNLIDYNPGANNQARVVSTAASLPTNGSMTNNVYNHGVLELNQGVCEAGGVNCTYSDGEYQGQIVGTGRVEKTGPATVFLNPTNGNTYSGGTYIKEGGVAIAADNALGDPNGAVFLGANTADGRTNGTLEFAQTMTLGAARNVTLLDGGGTIKTDNGVTATVAGNISGAGQLIKSGSGVLQYSTGVNTYQGGTWIQDGVLIIRQESDLGAASGPLAFGTSAADGKAGGTLRISGNTTLAAARGPVRLNDGGGAIDTNGQQMTITNVIEGSGRLTKTGAGTLTLDGLNSPNTYSGGTAVQQGTLAINSDAALGAASGHLALLDQTTLLLNAGLTSARTVTLAGQPNHTSVTVDTQGFIGNFTGTVDGAGQLVKIGTGVLGLYGTNLYSGGAQIRQGTLAINSDDALGKLSSALELFNRTTLRLDGNLQINAGRPVIIGDTGLSGTAPVQVTINTNGYNGQIDAAISQAANAAAVRLDKDGEGVLSLFGDNAHTGGTWVRRGGVAIKAASGLGADGNLYLGDTVNPPYGSGSLILDADITFDAPWGVSRFIYLNTGGGIIDTRGYTGVIAENTLQDGSVYGGGGTPPPGLGAGDLHKQGSGLLTVLGNQQYSGQTFVDAGTFRLDAVDVTNPMANTFGLQQTGGMTVAAGARLEGQGLIGRPGALTTNSGTIAPGLPGFAQTFNNATPQFTSLTLNGDYTAADGAVVEINTQLVDDASLHGTLVITGVVDPAARSPGSGSFTGAAAGPPPMWASRSSESWAPVSTPPRDRNSGSCPTSPPMTAGRPWWPGPIPTGWKTTLTTTTSMASTSPPGAAFFCATPGIWTAR